MFRVLSSFCGYILSNDALFMQEQSRAVIREYESLLRIVGLGYIDARHRLTDDAICNNYYQWPNDGTRQLNDGTRTSAEWRHTSAVDRGKWPRCSNSCVPVV